VPKDVLTVPQCTVCSSNHAVHRIQQKIWGHHTVLPDFISHRKPVYVESTCPQTTSGVGIQGIPEQVDHIGQKAEPG